MKTLLLDENCWEDFVNLMKTDSECSDCWCLNHRVSVADVVTGDAAQGQMNQLVKQGKVTGLLGYLENECVGWIAIDPMSELYGHDCQASGKSNEWSIHCMFVKDGFRGQGISRDLIVAAVELAKLRGASLISAFPIPLDSVNQFPVNSAEFSGRFSSYSKLGFKPADKISHFYQRMELT